MKFVAILTACLITAYISGAQTPRQATEMKQTTKRITQQKTIVIFPGEKLRIQTFNGAGKLKGFKLEEKLKSEITDFPGMTNTIAQHNSESNLSLDFDIIHPEEGKSMSVLLLKNPYKKRLIYKVKILKEGSRRFEKVKVQPIIPGLTGIITWNFPVTAVQLKRFKVATDD